MWTNRNTHLLPVGLQKHTAILETGVIKKGPNKGIFQVMELFPRVLVWWIHNSKYLSKPIELYVTKRELYCMQT